MTDHQAKEATLAPRTEVMAKIEAMTMEMWGRDDVQDYIIASLDKEGNLVLNYHPNKAMAERYVLADAPACLFERHQYYKRIK